MDNPFKNFFTNSDLLDIMVLRPLSHINMNWELTWGKNSEEYQRESDSFAPKLIELINEISETTPPAKYHDNEDCLAKYVIESLNWKITKKGNRWEGVDYESILEQGGFKDINEKNLVKAATGRIKAAIKRDQIHFDDMEESHQRMLAIVMVIIIYLRA
ncbi:MAG: hypothetical protein DSY77_13420 [Bacteroidetes bacterium]|nr:MAG: hypothetical protein DSY77_13420 [Bacteroidota bacterium]